jgi:hypothetical protein
MLGRRFPIARAILGTSEFPRQSRRLGGLGLTARQRLDCAELNSVANCAQKTALEWLTLFAVASTVNVSEMSVRKIQIGQLWRKNDTGDVYLVTRVYSEALSTIVVLRKSGAEDEALTRLRAENTPKGPGIPGYSPAQDEEKF